MDRKQLNFKMKLMLINKDEYNLYAEDGGRTDERLCLEKVSENEWHVFYLERGNRTTDISFHTEGDACNFFINEFVD